jgi:hypothetical protein
MSSTPGGTQSQPIRVIHLLLWVFASSVVLTLGRFLGAVGAHDESLRAVLFALDAIVDGAGIAAVFVSIQLLCQRELFFRTPGHYLIFLVGTRAIAEWLDFAISEWFLPEPVGSEAMFVNMWLGTVAVDCVCTAPTFVGLIVSEKPWKALFACELAELLLRIAHSLYMIVAFPASDSTFYRAANVVEFLAYGALVMVVVLDFRNRRTRDSLHWIGVAAWAAERAIQACWSVFTGL